MAVKSKSQLEVFKSPVVNICSISFKMLNEFLFRAGLLGYLNVPIKLTYPLRTLAFLRSDYTNVQTFAYYNLELGCGK